jgi:hypothetical protein
MDENTWIDESVDQIKLNCNLLFSNELLMKEIAEKDKQLIEYRIKWIALKKSWELEKLRRHEEIDSKNFKFLCDSIDTIFS